MNDTPSDIASEYHRRLMALSPEERFLRGALMFDTAREMVRASLPDDLAQDQFLFQLYQRIYGEPLPKDFRSAVMPGSH